MKLSEFGGLIKNLKVDGNFNKFNVLQKLYVVSRWGILKNTQGFRSSSEGD